MSPCREREKKKIKVLARASSWLLAQAAIGQHNLLCPVPRSALPGPDCRTGAPTGPRMLERRGHGGDVALWMEQCLGPMAVGAVVTLGSCAAAPRPGWTVLGVVLGVLLFFSPTFCCSKGNPQNPEGKLLCKWSQ